MKKVIWGAVAALLLFAAVIAGIMWNNFREDQQDADYGQESEPKLPTMSFKVLGYDANVLLGYRREEDSVRMTDALLPVRTTGEISVKIHTDSALVDSADALLYSLDGTRLIERAPLTLTGTQELTGQYQMTSLAEERTDYLLTFVLQLSDGTECFYSVKVCQYPDECFENKERLLGFAADFSDAACNKDQETVRAYTSYDREKAGTDLYYVNQNTDASMITWAGLEVKKRTPYLRIYEWWDTQVGIAFQYNAELCYGNEASLAAVDEAFCVRERDEKLFLLNYERYTREYFAGNAENVGSTSILLGIQPPDTMELLYTDYGINVYFTVDGGVWHYNYNTNELICVFTFGKEREDIRLDAERYDLKLSGIRNNILYFTVQGYMESGTHEGRCGIALYGYDIVKRECREYLYADLTGAENEGALTALSQDGLFYTNLGDCIYALDMTGSEALKLYEGLDSASVLVNEDGNLAVWQYAGQNKQLCLLDTKTGSMQSITADRELESFGFIGDDLVYGRKAVEQMSKSGFSYLRFLDQVCIADSTLERKAAYEKQDVLISSVDVTDSGVTLSRYKVDGDVCTPIMDDVLSLAGDSEVPAVVELKVAASEVKRNYYYINLGRTITLGETAARQAKMLLKEPVVLNAGQPAEQGQSAYAAYRSGICVSRTASFAEAISEVYDRMGVVYRSGFLSEVLWNRDARDLYLTMTLPTMSWTQEGHEEEMAAMNSEERGVDIFIYSGVNAGVVDRTLAESSERAACDTVYEELRLTFGEHLIDLTGSKVGYLLYYINLRHPVLCLTEEGKSLIITGYTSAELMIYDPATRETNRMAQEEAQEYFDRLNTIFVSFW